MSSEGVSVGGALRLGWRAATENLWLAAAGMLVSLTRALAAVPVAAFLVGMVARGAAAGSHGLSASPFAPIEGAVDALFAPRTLAISIGLWGAGALIAAALRAAYLAGALPTLGLSLSGTLDARPVFAEGVAWRFPRVAVTAFLAWMLEFAATAFAAAVWLGVVLATAQGERLEAPALAALFGAASLTGATLLPFATATLGDAALARAALRDEGPLQAFSGALRRFSLRPAAFLFAALTVSISGWVLLGSGRAAAAVVASVARTTGPIVALGSEILAWFLAAMFAAVIELWRFGTVAALSCSNGVPPYRPSQHEGTV